MTLVLSVLEQGMIYAIMALGIYITYTILDFPDLTVVRKFSAWSCNFRGTDHEGSKSDTDASDFISGRSGGRNTDRTDSCKIKGTGSVVRNYYDDSSLYGKSPYCGQGQCADL